jgi:hypothetical protein
MAESRSDDIDRADRNVAAVLHVGPPPQNILIDVASLFGLNVPPKRDVGRLRSPFELAHQLLELFMAAGTCVGARHGLIVRG